MRTTSGSPHRPHARDDLAARAGHEAEIAQAGQQDGAAAEPVIETRDFGEPGDDRGFAATQLGERTGDRRSNRAISRPAVWG